MAEVNQMHRISFIYFVPGGSSLKRNSYFRSETGIQKHLIETKNESNKRMHKKDASKKLFQTDFNAPSRSPMNNFPQSLVS